MRGLLCVVIGPFCATVSAAPQADLISSSWQLDFNFHDPQRISLVLPGDSHPTTFWYLLLEVTNNTGQEVQLYPSFHLVTDTLQVVEGGAGISPSVYGAIAERHKRQFPYFAPPVKISGPLLQGTENSRATAAVFRPFDPQASRFTIYISGLAGEIVRVPNPAAHPSAVSAGIEEPSVILQRTLAITYDMPGDPETRASAVPIRRAREWVMR